MVAKSYKRPAVRKQTKKVKKLQGNSEALEDKIFVVESSEDEDETVETSLQPSSHHETSASDDSDDDETKQIKLRVLTEIREDRRRTWNVIAQVVTKEELLKMSLRDNTPFDPDEDDMMEGTDAITRESISLKRKFYDDARCERWANEKDAESTVAE